MVAHFKHGRRGTALVGLSPFPTNRHIGDLCRKRSSLPGLANTAIVTISSANREVLDRTRKAFRWILPKK